MTQTKKDAPAKNKDQLKKKDRAKAIAGALDYASKTLTGIATANAPYQDTNYTPAGDPAQRPIDIDPFGTDNDAPA